MDTVSGNLINIEKSIMSLLSSALQGELDNRIDDSAFTGEWKEIVAGMNKLLDAIAVPIHEASEVMRHIAIGAFDIKMNGDYKGEFREMQNCVNTTVDNVSVYISEISHVLEELAKNNLAQEITREYVGSFISIKEAINHILDTFSRVISDLSVSAEQVSGGAKSISNGSTNLAQGASEQAASVVRLNAMINMIDQSSLKNAEDAENADSLSAQSKLGAEKGNEDMQKLLLSIGGIKESSDKVNNILKVIEDISFQTNLLALNAAVEAARAGEHGKGFSIVAEEVRTLAGRSRIAAKETAELIEESIHRVNEGTVFAQHTAKTLNAITEDVNKVAGIISGIAEASKMQSGATGQVTQELTQITDIAQENSATSEETAAASEELASQAEVLRNLVSVFKLR
jgi:methyl-accepting chemotaxis protein